MEIQCVSKEVEGRAELGKQKECFQVFLFGFPFQLIWGCKLHCEFQPCSAGNLKTEQPHELRTKKLNLASKKKMTVASPCLCFKEDIMEKD